MNLAPFRSQVALLPTFLAVVAFAGVAQADDPIEFNRDVRPILADKCFYCHGQDAAKREADLRLDDRAAAVKAGAIVPSNVSASELIERINSTDPDTVMPPPKSNRH
ncbi:MAG: hypothetical protein JNM18_00795, partial [Planctomycetaceae bacterium]|nr:hypothetical protein [Planctomycetaceae bacterium]